MAVQVWKSFQNLLVIPAHDSPLIIGTPITGPSVFDALPTELLETIFLMHVNSNYAPRMPLLLTCRLWYRTAIKFGPLWNNLYLGDKDQRDYPPDTIHCLSLGHFILALRRTAGSLFDLQMQIPSKALCQGTVLELSTLVHENWMARCRSLVLVDLPGHFPGWARIGTLFQSQSFPMLRILRFMPIGTGTEWREMVRKLMVRVEETAVVLETLGMIAWFNGQEVIEDISSYPRTLGRLRSIEIKDVYEVLPWSQLRSVEEVTMANHNPQSLDRYSAIPHRVQRLSLRMNPSLAQVPAEIYTNLTYLRLESVQTPSDPKPVHFPSLTSLVLCSSPYNLTYIKAPHLHELTILPSQFHHHRGFYPNFTEVDLTPRILHLVHNQWNNEMKTLVEAPLMWSKLEELHVTIFTDEPLEMILRQALSGRNDRERCFPALRDLSILYPNLNRLLVKEGDKIRKCQEMREIARARNRVEGLRTLEMQRVGWYRAPNVTALNDPLRIYWQIEWRDCVGSSESL